VTLPTPAQYLLRIDDLCPTVAHDNWLRMSSLIQDFDIRPILAVVPANQDPELECSPADLEFWRQMREMESTGATIALHGYRHLCRGRGKSLIDLHSESEFAGVPFQTQRTWIHDGLRILRDHGLSPQIFVAPRHGFDRQTLLALRDQEVTYLSDGFARLPCLRKQITWIPQQLWSPMERPKGLWTICLHCNTMKPPQFTEVEAFFEIHREHFTSFERVKNEYEQGPLPLSEQTYEQFAHLRAKLRSKLSAYLECRG